MKGLPQITKPPNIIETINRMVNLLQIDNDFIEKKCNNYVIKKLKLMN